MIGEGILYPEFALLKGNLLLAFPDPQGAELWFRNGFEVAGKLRFRTSELCAAIRLARGEAPDGRHLLRGAYGAFSEGFDTPDRIEARAILGEVTASS